MEKVEILSFPIYRFYYDDVENVYDTMIELKWIKNPNNWMWKEGPEGKNILDIPSLSRLKDWMKQCLHEVKEDLNLTCDSLEIISSWANLNQKGDMFHNHSHPNSWISSNYYVSGEKETKTIFHAPNPYFDTIINPIKPTVDNIGRKNTNLNYEEETIPGKYIVFPSTMWHYAMINKDIKPRITIAANVFPSGNISCEGVSRLNITVN